ncbi:hypothetical protein Nepgr_022816 [Nepenthes gracilis]|uniref:Transmembrane protein n=1 Tax=Nepenthes gracilis TaxID=150966 RepID=A0AAD3T1P7_NEPGR|nr:hypothetical protein Nepgr_022816 [Nepenthes gracilis]
MKRRNLPQELLFAASRTVLGSAPVSFFRLAVLQFCFLLFLLPPGTTSLFFYLLRRVQNSASLPLFCSAAEYLHFAAVLSSLKQQKPSV